MKLGIKATVDLVFKTVFGNEAHAGLTASLVNSVLERAGRRKAASLAILNPIRLGLFREDKDIVLDIRAVDEEKREFQIEVQVEAFEALPRRMLHNWAACYLGRLKKGEDYKALRPVVSIWILEGMLFRDGSWFHTFSLRDEASGEAAIDDILVITVELPAWIAARGEHLGDLVVASLDRWLYLLWKAEETDPADPPPELAGGEYQEALEIMAAYTKSDIARDAYRRRMDYQRTMSTIKAEAIETGLAEGLAVGRAEGHAEGHAEGRAEGRAEGEVEGARRQAFETARRLKALGFAPDLIATGTGLTREEVEEA